MKRCSAPSRYPINVGLCDFLKKWPILLVIREMQIRSTVRCHSTPTRMARLKKTDNNQCRWGHGGNKCSNKNLHMNVHSKISLRAKHWGQLKCPSVAGWINTMWPIHVPEYYSAAKRRETLTLATTWRDLEHTVLRERNQTHKATIPCMWNVQNRHIHRQEVG